jgi:hypothetical protein
MDFSSSQCPVSGAHPASHAMDTGGPFPGGKAQPGRAADHSPRLVPRLRMSRSYTYLPLVTCMAVAGHIFCPDRLCGRPSLEEEALFTESKSAGA